MADVKVNIMSPGLPFEKEPSEALGRAGTEVRTVEEHGVRADERMLHEFLPDMWQKSLELEERICLVEATQAKYHYYMIGERVHLFVGHPHMRDPFGTSRIMDEEECRKIITAGKHHEETGVAQVFREVLRHDINVPSE
ncbi:hypothetical protein ACLOJK_013888 [Asimina triloba]